MKLVNPKRLFLVCTLALSAAALAGGKGTKTTFKSMDTDKDGKISASEHAAGAQKKFIAMDTNKDRRITAEEMGSGTGRRDGGVMGRPELSLSRGVDDIDTDGDGVFTSDEYVEGAKVMFRQMDTDQDGFLTVAEFNSGHDSHLNKPS